MGCSTGSDYGVHYMKWLGGHSKEVVNGVLYRRCLGGYSTGSENQTSPQTETGGMAESSVACVVTVMPGAPGPQPPAGPAP